MRQYLRLIIAALTLLGLAGCAHKPGAGSYADAATTYVALSFGAFEEANPLSSAGNPVATALLGIGLKQGLKYGLTGLGASHCAAHRGVETTAISAAGWNAALLLGAGPPGAIIAALLSGTVYYRTADCDDYS